MRLTHYDDNQRILLFLIACIPVRFLIVGIAFYVSYVSYQNNTILSRDTMFNKLLTKNLIKNIFYLMTFMIGLGFIYIFISKKKYGAFGGKAWWFHLRIIHGINYLLYTYLAVNNYKNAFLILLFDVLIGILAFIINYFL